MKLFDKKLFRERLTKEVKAFKKLLKEDEDKKDKAPLFFRLIMGLISPFLLIIVSFFVPPFIFGFIFLLIAIHHPIAWFLITFFIGFCICSSSDFW